MSSPDPHMPRTSKKEGGRLDELVSPHHQEPCMHGEGQRSGDKQQERRKELSFMYQVVRQKPYMQGEEPSGVRSSSHQGEQGSDGLIDSYHQEGDLPDGWIDATLPKTAHTHKGLSKRAEGADGLILCLPDQSEEPHVQSKKSCEELEGDGWLSSSITVGQLEAHTASEGSRIPFKWEELPGKARSISRSEYVRNGRSMQQPHDLKLPPRLQTPPFNPSFSHSQSVSGKLRANPFVNMCNCMCKSASCRRPSHDVHFRGSFSSRREIIMQGLSANNIFDEREGKGLIIVDGRASFWPPSPSVDTAEGQEREEDDKKMKEAQVLGKLDKAKNRRRVRDSEMEDGSHKENAVSSVDDDSDAEKLEISAYSPAQSTIYADEGQKLAKQFIDAEDAFPSIGKNIAPSTSTPMGSSSWPYLDLSPITVDNACKTDRSKSLIKTAATLKSNIVSKLKWRKPRIPQADMWSPTLATYLYDAKQRATPSTFLYDAKSNKREHAVGVLELEDGVEEISSSDNLGKTQFREHIWSPAHWCGKNFNNDQITVFSLGDHHHDQEVSSSMDSTTSITSTDKLVFCKGFCKVKRTFYGLVSGYPTLHHQLGANRRPVTSKY